jgi:hypothetical protein
MFVISGKDEVRMGNGEKVALGLGSFGRPLAPHPAGADCDQRLADLVAGAPGDVFDALLRSFFILPSTAMVRRDVLIAEGMFQTDFRNTDDYDLWLRLGRKGRFLLRKDPLTYYERQPTSISRNTLHTGENEIKIFTGLLASGLTPRQRRLASRRLARRYFERAYHLRSTDPAESWRCLRWSLRLRPSSVVTWKLLLANLWHHHRPHATPQQDAQG